MVCVSLVGLPQLVFRLLPPALHSLVIARVDAQIHLGRPRLDSEQYLPKAQRHVYLPILCAVVEVELGVRQAWLLPVFAEGFLYPRHLAQHLSEVDAIASEADWRYSDFVIDTSRRRLLCVHQDHSVSRPSRPTPSVD